MGPGGSRGPMSNGLMLRGGMYSEVQCIMGNGHTWTPPCEKTDTSENITFP